MKTKTMLFKNSWHDFGNKLKYCVILIICVSLMSCDVFDNAFDNVFDSGKTNDENRSGNVSLSMSLESYPEQIVAPVESLKQTKSASNPVRSPANSDDMEVMIGTLLARNLDTGEEFLFDWYISFNKETWEVVSNKTSNLPPGSYNFSLLLENDAGSQQYAGEAEGVKVQDGDTSVSMSIRPIIGKRVNDIKIVTVLNEFKLEYPEIGHVNFSDPKVGVVIDGGEENVLKLDKNSGKSPAYVNVPGGTHDIRLNLYDAQLQRGKSASAQESVIIFPGVNIHMDIIPLRGKIVFSLPAEGGEAVFKFEIPAIVIQEAGGLDEVRAVHSVVGEKNALKESSLTLTATPEGNYRAEVVYNDFYYGEVSQSLEFYDNDPNEKIGYCAQTFSVDASGETLLCELTLRRRAVIGGHLLANIGINVFDKNYPVAGAVVYFDGEEIGVSGNDAFATIGYLEHFPIRGEYTIRAEYQDKVAEMKVSLEALEVGNIDLHLEPSLVAHYPFNGNANDESGNGNHGIVHGAVLTTDQIGNANKAYFFNGIDAWIKIPASEKLTPGEITLSAWAKRTQEKGLWQIIVGTSELQNRYWLGWHNNNIRGILNDRYITTDGAYNDTGWHHLALTHSSGMTNLFIDGDKVKTIPDLTGSLEGYWGNSICIGAEDDNNDGAVDNWAFKGVIDDVRIHNRALSENQVKELYLDICKEESGPVCGSDGNTYSSLCEARSAGIFDYTKGECPIRGLVHLTGNNYVHVWSSNGDGTFHLPPRFSPSFDYDTSNGRWESGDFNNDGKTDLVHLVDSNYVHVWFSNGDGNFQVTRFSPAADYAVSDGRWESGDFNNDGKADLVHLTGRNYIHGWFSNGDGTFHITTFSPSPDYDTSNGRWKVGDFNNDGKTDLVHLVDSNYVHVWFSNGDGNFQVTRFSPAADYAVSDGRWELGDFNNDGKADLVHLTGSNYVHVWFSNGNGDFQVTRFSPSPDYDTSNGRWKVGDFNNDGKTDLVHLVDSNYVHVWFSNGDGNFQVTRFSPAADYAVSDGRWESGDFNNDGKADLVHLTGSNYVHVWFSNGNGDFQVTRFSPSPDYDTSAGRWIVLEKI